LRVFQAILPLIRKSDKKTFIAISSAAGSISQQKIVAGFFTAIGGGQWGYRISKAALNALIAIAAADYTAEGITVVSVHPGAVETDMYYVAGMFYQFI